MSTDPKLRGRPRRRAIAYIRRTQPNCWLCGQPIDRTLPPNHRWSSTVDEVIPRSHGGSATQLSNLRHAHLHCNSSRGNRSAQSFRSRSLRASHSSRAW